MTDRIGSFVRIGQVFDPTDADLARMALEVADIPVLTPGLPLHHMTRHNAVAFGGMPILVPQDLAAEAIDLLRAIDAGAVKALEDLPEAEPIAHGLSFMDRFKELVFWWIGGITRPVRGVFLRDIGPRSDD